MLKNITLTECDKSKILQAVQDIYGYEIQELQVTPFEQPTTVSQKQINEEEYLLNLSKQLDSKSIWYKVRESLIKSYGQAIDKSWFSPLKVINEDSVNNKDLLLLLYYHCLNCPVALFLRFLSVDISTLSIN
nr:hypothetical protein [Orientia tsutsugamushi]